jgi:phosphoesterase RecJ-like protein
MLLKNLGNHVTIISPDTYPKFLEWLPENKNIIIFNKSKNNAIQFINCADTIVCLDFNNLDRIKDIATYVTNSKAIKILIDHHPNPDNFPDIIISETSVSSTAELLYQIIEHLNYQKHITKEIAECLFVGIMTDTGSFNYGFKPSTLIVASELLSYGINKDKIFNNIYNNFSANRMKLMGYCLKEKLNVVKKYNTAYISITQKEFKQYNYQTGDTEGFVNLPLSIENINFSALFTEQRDHIKISFRSKGNFNANIFAKNHFKGGGHKLSSGFEIEGELKLIDGDWVIK